MSEENQVKLVEITEQIISIQNADATLYEYLVEIDKTKLERFKQIQSDFQKMQNELSDLINKV